MTRYFKAILPSAFFLITSSLAIASEQSCNSVVTTKLIDSNEAKLMVYEVQPKLFDLGMSVGSEIEDIKRVTFISTASACHIQPIALERGGDWGWHLVWTEGDAGVFYARMDGEAWVSSPKKKIAELPASEIELKLTNLTVELHWTDAAGNQASRKSDDEGRYWD